MDQALSQIVERVRVAASDATPLRIRGGVYSALCLIERDPDGRHAASSSSSLPCCSSAIS